MRCEAVVIVCGSSVPFYLFNVFFPIGFWHCLGFLMAIVTEL